MAAKLKFLMIISCVLNFCESKELLIEKREGQWTGYQHYARDEEVVQKQNDKFLQNINQDYDGVQTRNGGRAFEVTEEVSPEGLRHGGYGYLDGEGNLHYVEYQKDAEGKVAESQQKVIESYEKSPKTETVLDNNDESDQSRNRGSSARAIRQIDNQAYQVPAAYPVTSQPELYFGFKPIIKEGELQEETNSGPTEATLEDFPIPDIGQQLNSFYQPIWNSEQAAISISNNGNTQRPEQFRGSPPRANPRPVSRPKKSPFNPYIAPHNRHPQNRFPNSATISNFYPGQKNYHLLVEENPKYSKPAFESSRFFNPVSQNSIESARKERETKFRHEYQNSFTLSHAKPAIHSPSQFSQPLNFQSNFADDSKQQSSVLNGQPDHIHSSTHPPIYDELSAPNFYSDKSPLAQTPQPVSHQDNHTEGLEEPKAEEPYQQQQLGQFVDPTFTEPQQQPQEIGHFDSPQHQKQQQQHIGNFDQEHYNQEQVASFAQQNGKLEEPVKQQQQQHHNQQEVEPFDVLSEPAQQPFPQQQHFSQQQQQKQQHPRPESQQSISFTHFGSLSKSELSQSFGSETNSSKDSERPQRSPQLVDKFRGSPGSVSYQQIIINGIETKFEIPKTEVKQKRNTNTLKPTELFFKENQDKTSRRDSEIEKEIKLQSDQNEVGGFVSGGKRGADDVTLRPSSDVTPIPVQTVRWPPIHSALPGAFDSPVNHLTGIEPPLDLPPVLRQPDPIFEGPKMLEDQIWSHRRSPSTVEIQEEKLPLPTTISPNPDFVHQNEPQVVPVFHEPQFHTEEQNVPPQPAPILNHDRERDFSTPIPKFRKPYPKEVKQLTVAPGNPIQLKHHGPFKVQPLHVRGPTPPTTTLSLAFISTLPPRTNVTPLPSQTVISTTFSTNRLEPDYQRHQLVSTLRPRIHPNYKHGSTERPVHLRVDVVVTPTTIAPSYRFPGHSAEDRNEKVSELKEAQNRRATLAPFLRESSSQIQPPVSSRSNDEDVEENNFVDKIRKKVESNFRSNLPTRESFESSRPRIEPVTKAGHFRPQNRRVGASEENRDHKSGSNGETRTYLTGNSEQRNFLPKEEDDYLITEAENHEFSKLD